MSTPEAVDILLVDDRPENILALEAILEPLGQNLVRAYSGDEALKEVLRHDFTVILLDVQMPGINGFDTARLIKSRERSRHIPIIFLTAISKEEDYVFEGYAVGAVDYMLKPLQPDILRSKVIVFIDLERKRREIKQQEELLRESERREIALRHEAQLLESRARLAEVIDTAMDAIIIVDPDQSVGVFNLAAERMFGLAATQAIGKSIDQLLALPDGAGSNGGGGSGIGSVVGSASGVLSRSGDCRTRTCSLVGLRTNGERFPVEATLSELEVDGRISHTLIARDITERRQAEEALRRQAESLAQTTEELRAANEGLEEAIRARSRFYASMSHELRTPINAILGYNSLLLENIYGPLNEKQTHGLERTKRAATHLMELVNDILDLSKIEAGKIDLNPQPVAFPALVEDLFVTVRPLADERKSELSLEHIGANPHSIVTDPRRTRQILLNLLSNAVKFGEGKPIRVISRVQSSGGVEVDVMDHGIGIAADDARRIFDEFVQVQQAHEQQGTGLGLAISQRLATLLEGSLSVSSVPGEGSTFRLSLPAKMDYRRLLAIQNGVPAAAPA
ncbi:MAG: ATP-binding protein [Gemmatimonadota bacterium]|nr:ATP-binding protein [Gemmatimonadota bacterium]